MRRIFTVLMVMLTLLTVNAYDVFDKEGLIEFLRLCLFDSLQQIYPDKGMNKSKDLHNLILELYK